MRNNSLPPGFVSDRFIRYITRNYRPLMIVLRKEKETNQQVLRRFNRLLQSVIQSVSLLKQVRDRQYFAKEPNRFARKTAAVRKTQLRDERQWY
jgi:hypothetical protein